MIERFIYNRENLPDYADIMADIFLRAARRCLFIKETSVQADQNTVSIIVELYREPHITPNKPR